MSRVDELERRIEQLEHGQGRLERGVSNGENTYTFFDLRNMGLTRRQAISAMVAIAGGAALPTALSRAVKAQPTGDEGQVGTQANPVEVWASEIDATEIATDERTIEKVGGRGVSNSTQSISNNSAATIQLDSVDTEDDASVLDVDTGNNRIRVKKAGWISMAGGFNFSELMGDGTDILFNLDINGTTIARWRNAAGANQNVASTIEDKKDLSVDDDITLSIIQRSGSAKNLRADERVSLAAIHEG